MLRRLADLLGRQGRRTKRPASSWPRCARAAPRRAGCSRWPRRLAALGRGADALELLREAVARDDAPSGRLALAGQLADLQRLDEADALLAALVQAYPRWLEPVLLRADLAGRRGDTTAERARLEEALARNPSQRPARERLAELGVPERPRRSSPPRRSTSKPCARLDVTPAPRTRWSRSWTARSCTVWPDGSRETLTQDLYRVRDLKGCEQMGELRLPGEVLRVATIKPDGTEFEPVLVQGSLRHAQPASRATSSSPRRACTRARRRTAWCASGGWYFASPSSPSASAATWSACRE